MSFKSKVLIASLLALSALPASAAVNNAATGDSSLLLTLIDAARGISATFDLGNKSTFNQSLSGQTWNLADTALWGGAYQLSGDTAATTWSRYSAGGLTNTQFGVYAGDSSGSDIGDRSIFTTAGGTTMNSFNNTSFLSALNSFDNYINAVGTLSTHNTVGLDNGSNIATSGNAYAGASVAYSTNGKIGGISAGSDTTGAIGQNLYVYNYTTTGDLPNSSVAGVKLSVAGFNPYFSLSNDGVLTYVAAVPEADSSLMMLAGIGLMGFIARRRKSV